MELTNINPACKMDYMLKMMMCVMVPAKSVSKELIQRQNAGRADSNCRYEHRNTVTDKALEQTCYGCRNARCEHDE